MIVENQKRRLQILNSRQWVKEEIINIFTHALGAKYDFHIQK